MYHSVSLQNVHSIGYMCSKSSQSGVVMLYREDNTVSGIISCHNRTYTVVIKDDTEYWKDNTILKYHPVSYQNVQSGWSLDCMCSKSLCIDDMRWYSILERQYYIRYYLVSYQKVHSKGRSIGYVYSKASQNRNAILYLIQRRQYYIRYHLISYQNLPSWLYVFKLTLHQC
jgi:hypothetical protein